MIIAVFKPLKVMRQIIFYKFPQYFFSIPSRTMFDIVPVYPVSKFVYNGSV